MLTCYEFVAYLETERVNTARPRNAGLALIYSFMRYSAIRDALITVVRVGEAPVGLMPVDRGSRVIVADSIGSVSPPPPTLTS